MSGLPFNKLCEFEDFSDPELLSVIRDVCGYKAAHLSPEFPTGAEHRKDWEVAMAVRTLDRFGAIRPDATILGVAAGTEDTLFYLTRKVRQVFATDRYLMPADADWSVVAPSLMVVEPGDIAPFDFDAQRLVVQHMDGRSLRYPDNTFDGVFSSGSIEHFGELQDVANAAYEMGRVLKPGGILSLSTEFKISGPAGGKGWPYVTLVFSPENIARYIIEASGLTPVDPLDTTVSEATLAMPRDLVAIVTEFLARKSGPPPASPRPDYTYLDFPHLVVFQEDYLFGSVHLALRKADNYPAVPNEWAKPPATTLEQIRAYNRSVAQPPRPRPAEPAPLAAEPAAGAPEPGGNPEPAVASLASQVRARVARLDAAFTVIDQARDEVESSLDDLGQIADDLGARANEPVAGQPDLSGWVTEEVTLRPGVSFTVVLDPTAGDPITEALLAGDGRVQPLIGLMLDLVSPGDRVLDLGSHVGLYALAAAARGCWVLAVEGSPLNAALLRRAAAINGFHQLHVVNAVVSDTPGTREFVADGPWGHVAWGVAARGSTISVPAVTADELTAEFGWRDASFIKIDVEGSEIEALAGMPRLTGGPDAPPILYESNAHTLPLAGHSAQELAAKLAGLGYVNYVVDVLEPRRLTRLTPGEVQAETVADNLAVKRRPPGLEGWIVVPSMTREDLIGRFVAEAANPNPDCRAYVARTLQTVDPALRDAPAVAPLLAALRQDADPAVRGAAAWSGPHDLSPDTAGAPEDRTEVTLQ